MLFSWEKESISTKQLKELMSCANWRGKPAFFQKVRIIIISPRLEAFWKRSNWQKGMGETVTESLSAKHNTTKQGNCLQSLLAFF